MNSVQIVLQHFQKKHDKHVSAVIESDGYGIIRVETYKQGDQYYRNIFGCYSWNEWERLAENIRKGLM